MQQIAEPVRVSRVRFVRVLCPAGHVKDGYWCRTCHAQQQRARRARLALEAYWASAETALGYVVSRGPGAA